MKSISPAAIVGRLALPLMVLMIAANAMAQESGPGPQVGRGSRVRVMTRAEPGKPVVGTVVLITADSIDLTLPHGAFLTVRRAEISSVELSIGQDRKTVKGAAIGAAVGVGIGFLLRDSYAYAYGNASDSEALAAGIASGAAWGALFGYRSRTDRWIAASLGTEDHLDRASLPAPPPPAPAFVPPTPMQNAPLGGGGAGAGLYVGSRVRVRHGQGVALGNVLSLDETALTIAGPGGVVPISRSSIATVEIWTGETRQTLKGALIGAVAVGAGDFLGEPECLNNTATATCTRGKSVAFGAASGAMVGAVIGALVKKSHWSPIALVQDRRSTSDAADGLDWSVAPSFGRKGAGLRFHLSW